jgi:alpha-glucosidase (family GH31 glycosyl hydrolase)
MSDFVSRREVLKRIGKATAGLALTGGVIRGQDTDIVVAGKPVEIVVASVSPITVRISVLPIEGGRTAAMPDTLTVVSEGQGRAAGRGRTAGSINSVKAGNLVVRYTANPPTLHIDTSAGQPVQKLTLESAGPGMSFLLPKGPVLGMGEGGPQFDRKGQTFANRSGQGGYQLATHGGRVPIQWLIGTDGWAIFVHRPLGAFDLTGTEGKLQPTAESLPLDVFVVSSKDPAVLMKEYARITGHPEMTALWTLGYQQSHRTLNGFDNTVKMVAQNFRQKKLPCDALIYLGTGFTPSGWNAQQSTTGFSTANTEFTFHPTNFPNPRSHIDELHSMHFKVVLHIVIESDNRQFAGGVKDPCPSTPQEGVLPISCYWPHHKGVFDLGIDGWWPDQGDGFNEPSRRLRHRMYWEGSQMYRPNERPYALHRNGAAGMARYAAFLWSGDVQDRWETLKNHVPSGINSGLSGIPYWGFDIGGFIPTPEYTGELFVRWFQFGAFSPLFRSHGRNWYLHLPWGWNTGDPGPQETANYTTDPKELRNPDVEPICKKYLELRYRMLPYIYTAMRETVETGLPMIRALWLHYPDDSVAVARSDEYMWGRDVLVAPVTEKGATSRKLYLPRGTWYDFWTEEKIEGGREIDRKVDLATTPLYVRAGAVLPMGPVKQYSDEPVDGPLTLVVYPGVNGTTPLYEDDGKTFDYRNGEFMKVEMNWADANRRLNLRLASGRMLPPTRRSIEARLAGQTTTRSATFEGRPVEIRL